MRKILSVLVLLLSLAGGSVFGYQVVAQNMPTVTHGSKAAYTMAEYDWSFFDVWQYEQKQPIYIFLGNSFMGKYEDGEWYSVSALSSHDYNDRTIFYLKDLVVVPAFQVYDMEQDFGDVAMLGWEISMGGIYGLDFYEPLEQEAMLELTGKTKADLESNSNMCIGYVELPNRIRDRKLRGVALPNYNAEGFFNGSQRGDEGFRGEALVLNAKHDPRPNSFKRDKELPEGYRQYFLEVFKREGMADAPLAVLDHCQYDADNDGEDEHIIILQNTFEDSDFYQEAKGKKNYGLYSYVFYADGERIQEVYKNTMLCTGNEAITQHIDVTALSYLPPLWGAYDLNGDGKLECCLNIGGWEWGSVVVYALDDNNEYNMVLCSNYGM